MEKIKEDRTNKTITSRSEDYSQWYLDVITAANMAEHAERVRGCMIIKPYGYSIWENIKETLDHMLKGIGVQNAYFPMFIPMSFLTKEKEHVEGFSPELAVVTHAGGEKLQEPLVVRPTSETIIYDAFSRWIHSYRDLPLVINQWANVVRWEKRPRLFLRTSEFLWQEGHTAHATSEEADEYAKMILVKMYKVFAEEFLAMPVLAGKKSENEKFAGAKSTYCIEILAQDGKSIQAGTSHNLSDHFSKVFGISFVREDGQMQFAYQTSWGVSTRLIGSIIMVHSDDKGLVLPPKIAPIQVVITPITTGENTEIKVVVDSLVESIQKKNITVHVDRRDLRPGEKYYEWEKKGVPLRIEIGPKDVQKGGVVLVRRDTGEKVFCSMQDVLGDQITVILQEIQLSLFNRALKNRTETERVVDTWDDFLQAVKEGGYIHAYWCEDASCETKIKEITKATTRCLPFDEKEEPGDHFCVHCGHPTKQNKRWVFAKAY